MTCQELFARLSEFIDGELPPGLCDQIRAHLSDCQPCLAFVTTLRQTVEICHQLPSKPLPESLRRDLKRWLQAERQRRTRQRHRECRPSRRQ